MATPVASAGVGKSFPVPGRKIPEQQVAAVTTPRQRLFLPLFKRFSSLSRNSKRIGTVAAALVSAGVNVKRFLVKKLMVGQKQIN